MPINSNDCISREGAIRTIKDLYIKCDTENMQDYRDLMSEAIEVLPSAQPVAKDINVPVKDCISRQAALDALGEEPEVWTDDDDYALGQRNQWRYDVTALKAVQSAQPGWIPCSERMPNEDYWTGANFQYSADVLMTVYNAEDEETIIDYGHTVGGSWYSDTTDCFVPSEWEVVAWMPLPKPWEGR